jgi:hypothetical protein
VITLSSPKDEPKWGGIIIPRWLYICLEILNYTLVIILIILVFQVLTKEAPCAVNIYENVNTGERCVSEFNYRVNEFCLYLAPNKSHVFVDMKLLNVTGDEFIPSLNSTG